MRRLLVNIHKVVVALMLLEVLLMLAFGLSYRGYEFDWLLVAALLMTGLILFFDIRKEISAWKRVYLFLYPVYCSILVVAFMVERIFFIVMLIPFLFFILPNDLVVSSGSYAIRHHPTIMGAMELDLYKNYWLLEKRVGTIDVYPENINKWDGMRVVTDADTIQYLSVRLDGRDTVLNLKRVR